MSMQHPNDGSTKRTGKTLSKNVDAVRCMIRPALLVLVTFVVLGGMPFERQIVAQEPSNAWTKPVAIVETSGRLADAGMAMVSDAQGNIHVFFVHVPDASLPRGLDYLSWNGDNWSSPVNVMINSDNSDIAAPQLAIDEFDILHLIWLGGGNTLYYATSPAAAAGSARSWSKPAVIGQALSYADIVAGPDNDLYVVYSDASSVGQVSLIRSTDGGMSWSSPVAIAQTESESFPGDMQLALDNSGRLHATWTVYSLAEGNAALGAFYTHSLGNDIVTWEPPLQFAGPRHGQAGIVTVGDTEVHLVWRSNIGGDGTFHQWSNDGGKRWFNPDTYDDKGGFSGPPSFAVDSLGQTHYVIGPVFYNVWSNGQLGEYQDIATAEVRNAATVSNGEGAVLSITTGNTLHVIFHTDFKHIWYTTRRLSAPAVVSPPITPRITQATQIPANTQEIRAASGISSTATALRPSPQAPQTQSFPTKSSDGRASSQGLALILGTVPAVILVLVVAAIRIRRIRA